MAATPDITVYWLEQSRADRTIWILEELGLPYEIEAFKREARLAPEEAKKIHPLGKFPMCKIDGQVVAESGLINDIIIEKYGAHLGPENDDEKYKFRYFNYYSEGSLMTPMVVGVIVDGIRNSPVPFFLKPIVNMIANKVEEGYLTPQYKSHLEFLEIELTNRSYIAGERFTGADIMLGWPLVAAKSRIPGYDRETYPKIFEYVDRLTEREAYKKTRAKVKNLEAGLGGRSSL